MNRFFKEYSGILKILILIFSTYFVLILVSIKILSMILFLCLIFYYVNYKIKIRPAWLVLLLIPVLLNTIVFFIAKYFCYFDFLQALKEGFLLSILFNLRIYIIIMINILIIKSLNQVEAINSLLKIKVPLSVIIFFLTIVGFIPLIFRECKRIIEVQTSRGLKLSLLMNPLNLLPILIPLIVVLIQKAQEQALILELRCNSWKQFCKIKGDFYV